MKLIKSAIVRSRSDSGRSLGTPSSPTGSRSNHADADEFETTLFSVTDEEEDTVLLEQYRLKVEDLHRLREAQEAQSVEEESEIAELRRQLAEAKAHNGDNAQLSADTTERRSSDGPAGRNTAREEDAADADADAEAVENAIRYLDGVIERVSKAGTDISEAEKTQPAEATMLIDDEPLVDASAQVSCAPSVDDTSSWQPAGTMARLLAAEDDSTVGTTSDGTWISAGGGSDLEDMQTCVSALTLQTMMRSVNGKAGSSSSALTSRGGSSAVIVAELHRIQSLLRSILDQKRQRSEQQQDSADDVSPGSIKRISSGAKHIARLCEKNLNQETKQDTKLQEQIEAERVIDSLANVIGVRPTS